MIMTSKDLEILNMQLGDIKELSTSGTPNTDKNTMAKATHTMHYLFATTHLEVISKKNWSKESLGMNRCWAKLRAISYTWDMPIF